MRTTDGTNELQIQSCSEQYRNRARQDRQADLIMHRMIIVGKRREEDDDEKQENNDHDDVFSSKRQL